MLRLAVAFVAAIGIVVVVLVAAPAGSEAADPDRVPRKGRKLLRWLRDGEFRATFTPEPAAHASSGPHGGTVRTWYSPQLVEDLDAGRGNFSRDAAMVKELFLSGDGSGEPRGYAVMLKTRATKKVKRRAWKYWETLDASRKGFDYRGRGKRLCANCHAGGVDYLLSDFRP